ncbi:uncharacterized protein BROUX77_004196 [Berkeleyomyces rouxiae]|uniref:uncharacterized protein n=1 Tax=Berkeleyomyces rouxiae TaxID=2035830 RepID=UPI003B7C7B72
MPTFQAINIEAEEVAENELETIRELHVDDALKLFQYALKLHAQGPASFTVATEAYADLFKSEIFNYPEAATEYERAERQPDQPSFLDLAVVDSDGTGTSLPQALYLAHKNRGQFHLDKIRHEAKIAITSRSEFFARPETIQQAKLCLVDFTAALDRDPSDAELWRKTARVAAYLQSKRTARYCLESAIELEDDPAVMQIEPPSIAESLAGEQLKNSLLDLGDDMALSHPVMSPWIKQELPILLRNCLDPIPFLPIFSRSTKAEAPTCQLVPKASEHTIVVQEASWTNLGIALLVYWTTYGATADRIQLVLEELEDLGDLSEENEDMRTPSVDVVQEEKEPSANSVIQTDAAVTTIESTEGEGGADDTIVPLIIEKSPEALATSANEVSRKRSQSVAGVAEPEEETMMEKRSKRTRRRETVEEIEDPSIRIAAQLAPIQAADKNLFNMTKNMLENLGVTDKSAMDQLNEMIEVCASEDRSTKMTSLGVDELQTMLLVYKEEAVRFMINKKGMSLSLSSFLEYSKSSATQQRQPTEFHETKGLIAFQQRVCDEWWCCSDMVFEWLRRISTTYLSQHWPDATKNTVVQLVSRLDGPLYERIAGDCLHGGREIAGSPAWTQTRAVAQMLLELHVEVYGVLIRAGAATSNDRLAEVGIRVSRWQSLCSGLCLDSPVSNPHDDPLTVRLVWVSVATLALAVEGTTHDHILASWMELRDLFVDNDLPGFDLPNNNFLGSMSGAAADREISKLTTMDFFLGIFQDEIKDPVHVIESLEPVLNPQTVAVAISIPDSDAGSNAAIVANGEISQESMPIVNCASQRLRDLWKFMESSDVEVRLFMWTRLAEAYSSIDYVSKEFSCNLRSIEMLVGELTSPSITQTSPELRALALAKPLKFLDDLVVITLNMALNMHVSTNGSDPFDIIDVDHLRASCSAVARAVVFLHNVAMLEDEVRIGMVSQKTHNNAFQAFLTKLRYLQVRLWCLLYTLMRFGVQTHPEVFPHPETELADYLAAIHQSLGPRKYCRASNKIFLQLMRQELLKFSTIDNWEDYLGQVLYDLYGLRLGVGLWEVQEHNCAPIELERKHALALVERIMILAQAMPMKDLLRSDLKAAIEQLQKAMGQSKALAPMIHNIRNYTEFMKRPILALPLYQAENGALMLNAVTVKSTPDWVLARHGWYHLLGMMAFARFTSLELMKRQTPGAIDDLRIATTYFRQQLQFVPDRWDCWLRIAQCFDYELDEAVLWTADRMNRDRPDLVKLQRQAIHCYTLALSYSWTERSWLVSYLKRRQENGLGLLECKDRSLQGLEIDSIFDLYYCFGYRLYSSSREPFAMDVFRHADCQRFFIELSNYDTFQKQAHEEMTPYKVWKFAAQMFQRAIMLKPQDWKSHYMYAKCLWKMYQATDVDIGNSNKDTVVVRPTVAMLLKALQRSVGVVSARAKNSRCAPILEPHYKILTVTMKLVSRGDMSPIDAALMLSKQPFGVPLHGQRGGDDGDDDESITSHELPQGDGDDDEEDWWESYTIRSLCLLRDKDKSNWQHRLIIRQASTLLGEDMEAGGVIDFMQARAAFNVLRDSMFTKTMVMNVWKCDAERAGRHYVYTERYTRFMVRLLAVLKDHENLELILRRIRKKGADFYHFTELWQMCCMEHMRVLRKVYKIPPQAEEEPFKSWTLDQLDKVVDMIIRWAVTTIDSASPTDDQQSGSQPSLLPSLACLKDAVELRKLNSGLLKAGGIDDLIVDAFSRVFSECSNDCPKLLTVVEKEKASVLPQAPTISHDQSVDDDATMTGTGENGGAPVAENSQPPEAPVVPIPKTRRTTARRPDIIRKAEQIISTLTDALIGSNPKSTVNTAANATSKSRSRSRQHSSSPVGGDDQDTVIRDVTVDAGNDHGEGDGGGHGDDDGDEDGDTGDDNDDMDNKGDETALGDTDPIGAELGPNYTPQFGENSQSEAADSYLESDLSDIPPDYDDDAPPPMSILFPNLVRKGPVSDNKDLEIEADTTNDDGLYQQKMEVSKGEMEVEPESEAEPKLESGARMEAKAEEDGDQNESITEIQPGTMADEAEEGESEDIGDDDDDDDDDEDDDDDTDSDAHYDGPTLDIELELPEEAEDGVEADDEGEEDEEDEEDQTIG